MARVPVQEGKAFQREVSHVGRFELVVVQDAVRTRLERFEQCRGGEAPLAAEGTVGHPASVR